MSRFRERRNFREPPSGGDRRLKLIRVIIFLFAGVIAFRLFSLQVLSNDFYSALAAGQHDIYKEIFPERGRILMQESGGSESSNEKLYPLATNQSLYLIYVDPRKIKNADELAEKLVDILYMREVKEDEGLTAEEIEAIEKSEKEKLKEEFLAKLKKENDPYEPLRHGVTEASLAKIKELGAEGIGYIEEEARYYPENNLGSHFLGFVGTKDNKKVGQYGLEGYFEKELGGVQGFLASEKDVGGRWIPVSGREWQKAEDGADIVITIDRNIEYFACGKLKEAVERNDADGGTVIVMDPKTGAIIAMCSYPDFNPNEYAKVEDINIYNNPAVFSQYEPGSIFKAITMAAALDVGKITPTTTYVDEGEIKVDDRTIKNSDLQAYGTQTMTQVLEMSLNTGAVFAVAQIGPDIFKKYVEDFGFGTETGIELDFENSGSISSLDKKGKIWSATASFGQGISVTPIQVVTAFSAIANGGKLVKPYIVDRIIKSDGEVIKTEPKVVRQAISGRTSALLGGMLVSVIENGHGKRAGVPGYYVAGKTGTAQVAKKDGSGYEKDVTIGSFIGFAPVEDPRFVMLTKIDHPRSTIWAEATAAPLFGEIAKFMLNYLKVPPSR
ncbi:penicillin-binding protein 2 [Candidatus Falkowbacteria bacterium]|nr:penicillin-binding protein 2 [Candidatus Falkowbacteria bacterium]